MDESPKYLRHLKKFQSNLKFPVNLTEVSKFFRNYPPPNPDISSKFLYYVEELNYLFLLPLIKKKYEKKTQKFKTINEDNIFRLNSVFHTDLINQNNLIVNYLSDPTLIIKFSEKITRFYFKQYFKYNKSAISNFEMIISNMKQNIQNSVLDYADSQDLIWSCSFTQNDMLTHIRNLFYGFPYITCIENMFCKIYRSDVIKISIRKYEDLVLKIFENIIQKPQICEELEANIYKWDLLSFKNKIECLIYMVLKASKALTKYIKTNIMDTSYSVQRIDIIKKIQFNKNNIENNENRIEFFFDNPIKLLQILERSMLRKVPIALCRHMLLKEINIYDIQEKFQDLSDDERQVVLYTRKLIKIIKRVLKQIMDYLNTNWKAKIILENSTELKEVFLQELKSYSNPQILEELKEFLDSYIKKKSISKASMERIDVRFNDDKILRPIISFILRINSTYSLQKLMIIPNIFQDSKFKELIRFGMRNQVNETFLYIWDQIQITSLNSAFRTISDLIPVDLSSLIKTIVKTCNLFSINSYEKKLIECHMKKLGKRLARYIENNFINCSVTLVAFGESLTIAKECILYLAQKLNCRIIDNLIILSKQNLDEDLNLMVTGKIVNCYFSELSFTRRSKDWFKTLKQGYGIHGNYKEKCVNINLNEYGIDENNLIDKLEKVFKLVNEREIL